MKRFWILLVLLLIPAFAQSIQVAAGSPFGLNAGIKYPLMPLIDARIYAGFNPLNASLGGGVDVLASVPLTDLYAGAGVFYGSGSALSALGTGNLGLRGVLGTYLNVGLPLIGVFAEIHPMYFPSGASSFGLGGALGLNIGF